MVRNPFGRRVLQATERHQYPGSFEPLGCFETTMREKAVITDGDRLTENGSESHGENQAGPTEKEGHKSEQGKEVDRGDADRVEPKDLALHTSRSRECLRVDIDVGRREVSVYIATCH